MKRKGFTLIELLAVIIILAIIALIATPIILRVIDQAQERANEASVRGYADGVRLASMEYASNNRGRKPSFKIMNSVEFDIRLTNNRVSCKCIDSTDKGVILAGCTVANNNTEYYYENGIVTTAPTETMEFSEECKVILNDDVTPTVTLKYETRTSNAITVRASAEYGPGGLKGYEFFLDGQSVGIQSSPTKIFSRLAIDTEYDIKVRVIAKNGKRAEAIETIRTRAIVAPVINLSPQTLTNGNVTATITFPEREEGWLFQYRVNEGTWSTYNNPVVITSNGNIRARIYNGTNTLAESWTQIENIDRVVPVITVNPTSVNHRTGDTFNPMAGVTSTKGLTNSIVATYFTSGGAATTLATLLNTPGTYQIRYNVRDAAGNNATQRTRTVTVTFNPFRCPAGNNLFTCRIIADNGGEATIVARGIPNYGTNAGSGLYKTSATISGWTDTNQGLFSGTSATHEGGDSYYFRGWTENNHVRFAGFWWRIVRIEGNGNIRLIYNGTVAANSTPPAVNAAAGRLGPARFNSGAGWGTDSRFVGFMYGTSCTSYATCHANTTSSTIKNLLDTWYANNIANRGTTITSRIAQDVIFCGDRNLWTGTGVGTPNTSYGARNRLDPNKRPSLQCINRTGLVPQNHDQFGMPGHGNGRLSSPIGLLSIDEYALGNMHLFGWLSNNGVNMLTMTPCSNTGAGGMIFIHNATGVISADCSASVDRDFSYRPVIALVPSTTFQSGNGTSGTPYIID